MMPQACHGVSQGLAGGNVAVWFKVTVVMPTPENLVPEDPEILRLTKNQPRPRTAGADLTASARDLLDAGDHFVHRLVDGNLLVDHAAHRLGPDILVVENGELVVF